MPRHTNHIAIVKLEAARRGLSSSKLRALGVRHAGLRVVSHLIRRNHWGGRRKKQLTEQLKATKSSKGQKQPKTPLLRPPMAGLLSGNKSAGQLAYTPSASVGTI